MKCSICFTTFPPDVGRCPGCGRWVPAQTDVDDTGQQGKGIYSFSKIGNLPPVVRHTTGNIDESLGGGFVCGCTYSIAGPPGAGKSTLLIPLLVNSPRGLYVSVEEHPVALATRANRLRLSLDAVDVAYLLDDGEILEAVDTYLGKSKKVTLVVIDSVSALFGRSWEDAAVFIDEVVKIFRRHRHGIALCVMHVNGDGDMAGLQDAQHSTDCNLTISVKEEIRTIQAIKNRQGPAFVKSVFRMTDTGLKKL